MAKNCKQLKSHSVSEKIKYIYIHKKIIKRNKQTFVISKDFDGSQEHYAEWKEDNLKRLYTVWFHLHNILKII